MSRTFTQTLPRLLFGAPRRAASFWDRMDLWLHRYFSRRSLAELDDYMLKDIGLSRLDADREAVKPFWRA